MHRPDLDTIHELSICSMSLKKGRIKGVEERVFEGRRRSLRNGFHITFPFGGK